MVETRVLTVLRERSQRGHTPAALARSALEMQAAEEKGFLVKHLWRQFLAGQSSRALGQC